MGGKKTNWGQKAISSSVFCFVLGHWWPVRVLPATYSQNYPQVKCISRGLAVDLFPSPLYSVMFCGKEEVLFSLVPLL